MIIYDNIEIYENPTTHRTSKIPEKYQMWLFLKKKWLAEGSVQWTQFQPTILMWHLKGTIYATWVNIP